MPELVKSMKFVRVENATAAGTSDITTEFVDTAGFDEIIFVTLFGTITAGAVTSVKAQQSTTSNGSDAADLLASSVTVADDDDNQMVVHSVFRPRERYVNLVIDRGTQNAVLDGCLAILCQPSKSPVTDDSASVVDKKVLTSPAEGTA